MARRQGSKQDSCDFEERWLTTEEAINLTGFGRTKFYQNLNKGLIPGKKIGGEWRFSREELLDAIKDASNEPFVFLAEDIERVACSLNDQISRYLINKARSQGGLKAKVELDPVVKGADMPARTYRDMCRERFTEFPDLYDIAIVDLIWLAGEEALDTPELTTVGEFQFSHWFILGEKEFVPEKNGMVGYRKPLPLILNGGLRLIETLRAFDEEIPIFLISSVGRYEALGAQNCDNEEQRVASEARKIVDQVHKEKKRLNFELIDKISYDLLHMSHIQRLVEAAINRRRERSSR